MADVDKKEKSFKFEINEPKKDTTSAAAHTKLTALIVPPDGGWGWVVMIASFLCNFLVDGIIFSGGIMLKHIQLEFNASEKEVAPINSLLAGFYMIAGPFVSALTNRYGFRIVTIVGTLISVIGFILSYFATNVCYLYLTYGVIGGIGFCMIYMPAVVIIGFYFEKWRGLATGLALCGSGVGTFILAPFTDKMIELFSWRITILIHAGLVLLCVLCGAVFRPLEPMILDENEEHITKNLSKSPVKILSSVKRYQRDLIPRNYSDLTYNRNNNLERIFRENLLNVRRSSDSGGKTKDLIFESKVEYKGPLKTFKLNAKDEDNMKPLIISSPKVLPQEDRICRSRTDLVVNPLYRNDMFYSGSLKRLPEYSSRYSLEYHLAVSHCDNEYRREIDKNNCMFDYLRKSVSTMLDFSLFRSVTFIILTISGLFTMTGLFVPYMFVPQRAESHGVDDTVSVFLVSTMGIANIIGRIASGLISTAPKISSLLVYSVALTIGGIATIASGICYHEVYQFTYCVIFGLSIACFASLRSILVVEFIGLNKLTNCFGLFLLFQGIGALIGAPIAGALKDLTGDYDTAFYVSGGFLLLSGVVCYPVQCVHKWEKSRTESCEPSL